MLIVSLSSQSIPLTKFSPNSMKLSLSTKPPTKFLSSLNNLAYQPGTMRKNGHKRLSIATLTHHSLAITLYTKSLPQLTISLMPLVLL